MRLSWGVNKKRKVRRVVRFVVVLTAPSTRQGRDVPIAPQSLQNKFSACTRLLCVRRPSQVCLSLPVEVAWLLVGKDDLRVPMRFDAREPAFGARLRPVAVEEEVVLPERQFRAIREDAKDRIADVTVESGTAASVANDEPQTPTRTPERSFICITSPRNNITSAVKPCRSARAT